MDSTTNLTEVYLEPCLTSMMEFFLREYLVAFSCELLF